MGSILGSIGLSSVNLSRRELAYEFMQAREGLSKTDQFVASIRPERKIHSADQVVVRSSDPVVEAELQDSVVLELLGDLFGDHPMGKEWFKLGKVVDQLRKDIARRKELESSDDSSDKAELKKLNLRIKKNQVIVGGAASLVTLDQAQKMIQEYQVANDGLSLKQDLGLTMTGQSLAVFESTLMFGLSVYTAGKLRGRIKRLKEKSGGTGLEMAARAQTIKQLERKHRKKCAQIVAQGSGAGLKMAKLTLGTLSNARYARVFKLASSTISRVGIALQGVCLADAVVGAAHSIYKLVTIGKKYKQMGEQIDYIKTQYTGPEASDKAPELEWIMKAKQARLEKHHGDKLFKLCGYASSAFSSLTAVSASIQSILIATGVVAGAAAGTAAAATGWGALGMGLGLTLMSLSVFLYQERHSIRFAWGAKSLPFRFLANKVKLWKARRAKEKLDTVGYNTLIANRQNLQAKLQANPNSSNIRLRHRIARINEALGAEERIEGLSAKKLKLQEKYRKERQYLRYNRMREKMGSFSRDDHMALKTYVTDALRTVEGRERIQELLERYGVFLADEALSFQKVMDFILNDKLCTDLQASLNTSTSASLLSAS